MKPLRSLIPGIASGFACVFGALAAHAAPPPIVSPSEWAAAHRQVSADSGSPHPGKWSNDRAPYLNEVMDACALDNGVQKVVITGGAQFGKSDAVLNAIFRQCDVAPRPILLLLPSLKEVIDYSELKWDSNVKETTQLHAKLFQHKARSSEGSTTRVKRGRGFRLELTTAAASRGLQMRSVACVVCEEVDQYQTDEEGAVGVGGDPIIAAEGRMDAYKDDRKTILASTPGFAGESRIWREFEASDQRRWHTPCVHCGDFSILDFATFSEHEGRPVFHCTGCGGILEEMHNRAMNAAGVWVPCFDHPELLSDGTQNPAREKNPAPPKVIPAADMPKWRARDCEGRPVGFHLWQGQSNLASWSVIWKKWRDLEEDKAEKGADIEFAQKTLGVPFERKVERPDDEKLYNARGILYPDESIGVPDWAGIVTGAIDVQHNRLEWAVYAWGRGGVGVRIRSGVIPKNPLTWATWADDALALVNTQFGGPAYRPRLADYWMVDSGGNATDEVYAFCLSLQYRAQPVLAIKGATHDKGDHPALVKGNSQKARRAGVVVGKTQLWLIGTHGLKSRVYLGLAAGILAAEQKKLTPGALVYPRQATKEDFKQLSAEHLQRKDPRVRGQWVKPQGVANEQLDLAVYCLAGAINSRLDDMNDLQWAELMAKRAPDKVKAELTPLERLALPDDDTEKVAAAEPEMPKLEPPPAEARGIGVEVSDDDLSAIEALGRQWGGE